MKSERIDEAAEIESIIGRRNRAIKRTLRIGIISVAALMFGTYIAIKYGYLKPGRTIGLAFCMFVSVSCVVTYLAAKSKSMIECPECKKAKRKGYLLKRKNKKQDSYFYGCNQYPKCKYTESDTIDQFDV